MISKDPCDFNFFVKFTHILKFIMEILVRNLEVLEKMEKEQKIIEMDETSNKINP